MGCWGGGCAGALLRIVMVLAIKVAQDSKTLIDALGA